MMNDGLFFFSPTERAKRIGPDFGWVLGHYWLWTLPHQLRQQTDVPLHHQQNAELQERRAACHCEFGFITHKSFLQPHHQALPRSKPPSARPADECFLTPQSAHVIFLMNNITQDNFIWLNSQNGKRSEIIFLFVLQLFHSHTPLKKKKQKKPLCSLWERDFRKAT